ncbi:MAG: ABC transporter ATP-binding protein [Halanaerobiales bacterium]|nr:ABC transporter ATP-binding protein [Halanaerobiales bacterium]
MTQKHDNIIEVKNLKKWFPIRRSLNQMVKGERKWIKAVDGVTFNIRRGEIFGLIGESGCGKTTTGKMLMKLHDPSDGKMLFNGEDVTHVSKERLRLYKRDVQMIFQDPYSSMNPRFKIKDVLTEPLVIHKIKGNQVEREELASQALSEVKLTPPSDFLDRFPHMLSGGQRQRAATARTLILSPNLVIADEPVSMVDLSTRAELLQMMKDVQQEHGLTYLYITHDLSTARYFTDRIAVMYLGKIIELGTADEVIDNTLHPYTKALIAAVCEPIAGKVNRIKKVPIKGEIPSAANIPSGCRFNPRCLYAKPECLEAPEPELTEVTEGHFVACSRYREVMKEEKKILAG